MKRISVNRSGSSSRLALLLGTLLVSGSLVAEPIYSDANGNAQGFALWGAWGGASWQEATQPQPASGDGDGVLHFSTQQQWDGAPLVFNPIGQDSNELRLRSMSPNPDVRIYMEVGDGNTNQSFQFTPGHNQWTEHRFTVDQLDAGSVKAITFKQSSSNLDADVYFDELAWSGPSAGRDSIVSIDAPGRIKTTGAYDVRINLTVTQTRDLVVALKNPVDWQWHGESRITVSNSGWHTLSVNVEGLPADGEYIWEARLLGD